MDISLATQRRDGNRLYRTTGQTITMTSQDCSSQQEITNRSAESLSVLVSWQSLTGGDIGMQQRACPRTNSRVQAEQRVLMKYRTAILQSLQLARCCMRCMHGSSASTSEAEIIERRANPSSSIVNLEAPPKHMHSARQNAVEEQSAPSCHPYLGALNDSSTSF